MDRLPVFAGPASSASKARSVEVKTNTVHEGALMQIDKEVKSDNTNDLRLLDSLVAEKVMGHKPVWFGKQLSVLLEKDDCPRYSRDIGAAFAVVERMREQGWSFACTLYTGKLPYASFCKNTAASSRNAEADSLSHAICAAALSAINSTEKE